MNEQNRLSAFYGKVKVLDFNIFWWKGKGEYLDDIEIMKVIG